MRCKNWQGKQNLQISPHIAEKKLLASCSGSGHSSTFYMCFAKSSSPAPESSAITKAYAEFHHLRPTLPLKTGYGVLARNLSHKDIASRYDGTHFGQLRCIGRGVLSRLGSYGLNQFKKHARLARDAAVLGVLIVLSTSTTYRHRNSSCELGCGRNFRACKRY